MDFFMGIFLAVNGLMVHTNATVMTAGLIFMLWLGYEGFISVRAGHHDLIYWLALGCVGIGFVSWSVNGFTIPGLYFMLLMLGAVQAYPLGLRMGKESYSMIYYGGFVWLLASFFFDPAPNVNGLIAVGLLYVAIKRPKKVERYIGLVVYMVYLALLGSRTGIVGALLVIVLTYTPKKIWERWAGAGLIGLVVVVLALMRVNTLENRYATWQQGSREVLNVTIGNAFLGSGPTSISQKGLSIEPSGKNAPHFHNLWLSALVEVGGIGAGLLFYLTALLLFRIRNPYILTLLLVSLIDQPFFTPNVIILSGLILGAVRAKVEEKIPVPDPAVVTDPETVPTGDGPILV